MGKKIIDTDFELSEEKAPVNNNERFTVFALIRKVLGHVHDSTNRQNNILMLLYFSFIICGVSLTGSVFYRGVDYNINIQCDNKSLGAKRIRTSIKKTQSVVKSCNGSPIYLTASLNAPAPLPSTFYVVNLGFVLAFASLYAARHVHMREWISKTILAWKGIQFQDSVSTSSVVVDIVENTEKTGKGKVVKEPSNIEAGDI